MNKIKGLIFGVLLMTGVLMAPIAVDAALYLGSEVQCSENGDWYYREYYNYGSDTDYEYNYTGEIVISDYEGNGMQIVIPGTLDGKSVVEIGNDAFYNCTNIKTVNFTQAPSVKKIGNYAFQYCSALQTVTWDANNIETIGESAFYGCEKLKNITIPTNAAYNKIENSTFANCESLAIITLPANVQNIGEYAFKNCGMTSFNIPNTVINIERYAFSNCSKLKSITLPQNDLFTTIPDGMLKDCRVLDSITIPANIDTLGYESFCRAGMTSLIIPSTVTTIEDDVFYGCGDVNLKYIQFKGTTPPTFGSDVFYGCDDVTVIVPTSTTNGYKTEMANAGMGSTSTYMESNIDITIIPVPSEEYNEKLEVVGKLYEGIQLNKLTIKGTFRNSTNNAVVAGKLTWQEPTKKYERGGYNIGWIFTPSSPNALKVTGTIYVSVESLPSKPYSITVKSTSKNNVKFYWSSVYDVAGYEIWRQEGNGKWTSIGTTAKTEYTAKKLGSGKNYQFKVRPYGLCGTTKVYGEYSSIIKTATKPVAPAIKKLKKKGSTITVTWKKAISGANGYEIAISNSKKSGYVVKTTIKKAKSKTGKVKKLVKKKTYYVKVRAYKVVNGQKIYSAYSKPKKIKL